MDSSTARSTPRVSPKTVIVSIALVWATYFVLVTLRSTLLGLDVTGQLMWRRAAVTAAAILATIGLWPLLRALERFTTPTRVVATLLLLVPFAFVVAGVNQIVFAPVAKQVQQKLGEREGVTIRSDESGNVLIDVPGRDDGQGGRRVSTENGEGTTVRVDRSATQGQQIAALVDLALNRYFVFLAWAALYFALVRSEAARSAERQAGEFREAARTAELRSLRYQVNPHFLFNTLNSLSALVMTGRSERAETMIQTISNFYRHSLSEDPTGDVELADEIDLQRHYLEIESVRFPKRLKVEIDVPADLEDRRVPGMILQPLVENAVKYGVAPSTEPVTIAISARRENGDLVLRVADSGASEPGFLGGTGFGIGLANVRDRLKARFGRGATLSAGPDGSRGWVSMIRIPGGPHG
ncbi:sensor histidine kinase [Pseudoblastomonas halimionae]|uniref:Sensor histidine kinase n=1 Tax=Alteriqipengyuania halimionae TaxID=1926630 RepID=A0A6I4U917_9SPHN|nr:histidine kinase [Alteriqipengyuania halimionae]MXP10821.1 sensor histidine kinase [Alteriqipengyuania halimionae]